MITITITTKTGEVLEQVEINTFDRNDYHGVAMEQIADQIARYAKSVEPNNKD
jgi:hypothetical protein